VEEAARVGETGGLVRSWLGRTCPPATVTWREFDEEPVAAPAEGTGAAARARGRFTRNFVIQATAAEWALVLLATLRTDLAGTGAALVFFQHDEVIVHSPAELAAGVAERVTAAGERARQMLFGGTPVRFPLGVSTVDSYADAK
jgi:DNA polymerase-1